MAGSEIEAGRRHRLARRADGRVQPDRRRHGSYLQGFGGDTSNFAIAAARQGARVGLRQRARRRSLRPRCCASCGTREGVDHARREDRRRGLHRDLLRHPRRRRPPLQLLPRRLGGEPHDSRPTCRASASPRPACCTCRASRWRSRRAPATRAYAAIDIARAAGVQVCFDTNLRLKLWSIDRARAVMTDVMRRCDICLPSFDDITAITGLTEPDAIVDHCLALGASVVALKLGAARCDRRRRRAAPPHRAASLPRRWTPLAPATPSAAPSWRGWWPATRCSRPGAMPRSPRPCRPRAMVRSNRFRMRRACVPR